MSSSINSEMREIDRQDDGDLGLVENLKAILTVRSIARLICLAMLVDLFLTFGTPASASGFPSAEASEVML